MPKTWELINQFSKLKHQFEEHSLYYLASQILVIFHKKLKRYEELFYRVFFKIN